MIGTMATVKGILSTDFHPLLQESDPHIDMRGQPTNSPWLLMTGKSIRLYLIILVAARRSVSSSSIEMRGSIKV